MGWIKEKFVEWLKKEPNREEKYYISTEYIRQFEVPFLHHRINMSREARMSIEYEPYALIAFTESQLELLVEAIAEHYVTEVKCIDGTYVAPDFLIDAIKNLSFASEYKPRTADVILKEKISNKIMEMLGADVIYSETKYAEHLEEVRIQKQIEEKLGLSLAEIKKVL